MGVSEEEEGIKINSFESVEGGEGESFIESGWYDSLFEVVLLLMHKQPVQPI